MRPTQMRPFIKVPVVSTTALHWKVMPKKVFTPAQTPHTSDHHAMLIMPKDTMVTLIPHTDGSIATSTMSRAGGGRVRRKLCSQQPGIKQVDTVGSMAGLPVTLSFGPNSRSVAMPSLMSRFGDLSSTRRISLAYSSLSVWALKAHTAGPCAAPFWRLHHNHAQQLTRSNGRYSV